MLVAAGLGSAFWLGSLVQWWTMSARSRDGFELMGVMLSTAFFVVLVLPTLLLGLIARWLPFAAVLGVIVVALASDVPAAISEPGSDAWATVALGTLIGGVYVASLISRARRARNDDLPMLFERLEAVLARHVQ